MGENDFWECTPRKLLALIDAWRENQIYKAQIYGHISNGGSADDFRPVEIVEISAVNVF